MISTILLTTVAAGPILLPPDHGNHGWCPNTHDPWHCSSVSGCYVQSHCRPAYHHQCGAYWNTNQCINDWSCEWSQSFGCVGRNMVEYCGRNVDWCDAHHCRKEQWCGTLDHGRRRESEQNVIRGGEQELDAPADDRQELDAPADEGLGLDAPAESTFSEWLSETVDTLLGADDSAADAPVDTETESKSEVSAETVDASETDPQEATETTAAPQTDEQRRLFHQWDCMIGPGDTAAHGWSGELNSCGTCQCNYGQLSCTNTACGGGSPSGATCTLSDGQVVLNGWSGQGAGWNSCNQCYCSHGSLTCTSMTCPYNPTLGSSCTLSDGQVVNHGWSGQGAGSNYCNFCQCNSGALSCTHQRCY